jgi:hypothetical protein
LVKPVEVDGVSVGGDGVHGEAAGHLGENVL